MRSVATRLSELSTQAPVITAQRAQLLTQQAERAQTKTQLDETDKQIREVRGTVGKTEAELATLAERERALRHRAQVLAWLREAKPAHDAFAMRHTALNGEIGAFSKALAGQSESLEKLTNQLNATQAQLAQTVQQMEVNRKLIVALTDFAERYLQWQQHIARRRELEQSATQSNTLLAGLQQELQTTTTESNNAALEERRAAAEVARIERMQSDLQNLLGALEAHVTNAHCPACGIRHDSKDDLLRRLREQRNASAVSSDATSKLQEARQRVATLQARVEELKTRRQNAEQTVKAAAAELQNLVVTIDGFETLAREHALDSADTALSARIEERLKSAQSTNNNLVRISGTREQAVQAARTQLATARAQTQTRQQELAAKKQSFDEITTQLNSLRSEAARVQVTLDTDLQELAESENATRRETEEVIAQTTVKRNDLSSAKTSLNERDSRAQNLKQRLDAQDVAIRSLQRVIEKHERDIESLALTRQADQLQIAAKGEEEARRVSLFEELKQSVTGLEMALDVAVTSAASAELTTRIRAADGELGQLRQKQVQDKRWAAYFEQVLDKLVQTQNLAVAGYTGEYGPLTSIIQRRLRAVSGFEGIELQPKDGNIDVRVIRNGEHLRPPDFFSQSQQQILILSLFLTACTTQTWSAFAPILLDDPVTHFDDLNAYSFLDLISGLSESGLRGR
jgi:exonuclease SbcC